MIRQAVANSRAREPCPLKSRRPSLLCFDVDLERVADVVGIHLDEASARR